MYTDGPQKCKMEGKETHQRHAVHSKHIKKANLEKAVNRSQRGSEHTNFTYYKAKAINNSILLPNKKQNENNIR